MPWWALAIEVFAVWILWCFAAVAGHVVDDTRNGIPDGSGKGVSIVPIMPVFPLVFLELSLMVDQAFAPWGTRFVSWLHVLLGLGFMGFILRAAWRNRSIQSQDGFR